MSQAIKNIVNIWKNYAIWISASGLILIIGLASYLVVMPMRKNMEKNSEEAQGKVVDREIYEKRISEIAEMKKTQEIFTVNESNLRVFLDKNTEVDFIKAIEGMAEEAGNKIILKIEDLNDPKAKKEAIKKGEESIKGTLPRDKYLSLQINLEGNYDEMLAFLNKLENMSFYVDVISLDLSKDVVEKEVDPFATVKSKSGEIITKEEIVKTNLNVIVYLEG